MKKSDLEQIIKEEITTVITENFLKNLVQAGIKLFSKIRFPKMNPAQQKAIIDSIKSPAAKGRDYEKLYLQIGRVQRYMKDNKMSSIKPEAVNGKIVGPGISDKFPAFMKRLLDLKGTSISAQELNVIAQTARKAAEKLGQAVNVTAYKGALLPPVGTGAAAAAAAGGRKITDPFPQVQQTF